MVWCLVVLGFGFGEVDNLQEDFLVSKNWSTRVNNWSWSSMNGVNERSTTNDSNWSRVHNSLGENWARVNDWSWLDKSFGHNWAGVDDWGRGCENWSSSDNTDSWSSNDLLVTNRILYQYR